MKTNKLLITGFSLAMLFSLSSCATFLTSGQAGKDVVPPPPQVAQAGTITEVFVGGSFPVPDTQNLKPDQSWMAQGGVLKAWRQGESWVFFDTHVAASAWYGAMKLVDRETFQYIPAATVPLNFFGTTVQGGLGSSFALGKLFLINAGLCGQLAYEAGDYRAYRSVVKSSNPQIPIKNLNDSGFSGLYGFTVSYALVPKEDLAVRLGVLLGYIIPDLAHLDEYFQRLNPDPAKQDAEKLGVSLYTVVPYYFGSIRISDFLLNVSYQISVGAPNMTMSLGYIF